MEFAEIYDLMVSSGETFIKFVSANDAGDTGGHQGGIYLPKPVIPMFFDTPGRKGENKEKFITIHWSDQSESKSRLIYYGKGTRNEYRITRLKHDLKFNALFILIRIDSDNYKGVQIEEGIDDLLGLLNLNRSEIGKGIIWSGQGKTHTTQIDLFDDNEDEEQNTEIEAKFKPRARLLIQLGDQLIKNESIALIELVKNSYDADANKVNIYMENVDEPENGIIIIEDDGYGMSLDIVEHVWLEPGSDFKTKKIKAKEYSPKYNRLPIGEKGIGRFGVHKLGNVIEMTTKASGRNEVFVKIDWTDFENYEYLEDVPIKIIERDSAKIFKEGSTGTNIVISNLRKEWERGIARNIKRSITALVSPFQTIDSFQPSFDVFDKPGWFEGLLTWDKVREYSLFRFKATISENRISKFSYEFTPWQSMSKLSFRSAGVDDKIVKTFRDLEDHNGNTVTLSNSQIGEVVFEGYIFELDSFVLKMGVTDKSGFKTYLKENGGVRVFRDGLRIYDYGEPENDWLDLNLRRVNQPAKRISNNIILGAVYLDRKSSPGLVEKTNREGFVENSEYTSFKKSIIHVVNLVETLRFLDKTKLKEIYGPTPKSTPVMHLLEEVKNYVDKNIKEEPIKKQLNKYLLKIEGDYKRVTENLLKAAGAGLSLSVVIHEVDKIIIELSKVVKVEKGSDRTLRLVEHLSSLVDGYAEIISESNKSGERLSDIIDQALFNSEYRIESHNIEIIKSYKNFDGNDKLKVAKNLLVSSLMNLIDNSIYWLERAKRAKSNLRKKVYLNIEESESKISIVMADNGTGFLVPTDDITEPFVSAKPGGIGLGLHIASEVMDAQGGRLLFPDWGDYQIPEGFKDGAIIVFEFKK